MSSSRDEDYKGEFNRKRPRDFDDSTLSKEQLAKRQRTEKNRLCAQISRARKKAHLEELEARVKSQADIISALTQSQGVSYEKLIQDLGQAKAQITGLEAEKKSLQDLLEKSITTDATKIDALHQEMQELRVRSRELKAQSELFKNEKLVLQAEIDQLEMTHFNPLTGCYSRGTKLGVSSRFGSFFFNQEPREDGLQTSSRDRASLDIETPDYQEMMDLGMEPLKLEEDEFLYPNPEFF